MTDQQAALEPRYPQCEDDGTPIHYDVVCRKCGAIDKLESVAVVTGGFDVSGFGLEPDGTQHYESYKVRCLACGKWSRDEEKLAKVVRRGR